MSDPAARARAALEVRTGITRSAREQRARQNHGVTAEMGYTAALVAERLARPDAHMPSVIAMLRDIQNAGHLAFVKAHGSEADCQAIQAMVEKRYRTPSAKWRLRA